MTMDWSSEWDELGACRGGSRHEEQERENGFHFLKVLWGLLVIRIHGFLRVGVTLGGPAAGGRAHRRDRHG